MSTLLVKNMKRKTGLVKIIILLTIMLVVSSSVKAQEIQIHIDPTFNGLETAKKTWYTTKNKDSIQLHKLKFYLTNFKIKTTNGKIQVIENSNYLVDVFDKNSLTISLPLLNDSEIYQLIFDIGVDKKRNVSGANSGDLDPVKGMYWSWQSGYINFKLEGKSPSCATRKNKFQFHIGGYKKPYLCSRTLKLDVQKKKIRIDLNIATFFDNIGLSKTNQVIIPGKEAYSLADNLPTLFYIDE